MGDFLKTGSSEGKKIGRYEGKPFTLNSLSSNPPALLSSDNHPSPQPSPTGEGVFRHSEPTGERIQLIIARSVGWDKQSVPTL